jgi:hypothetical protein
MNLVQINERLKDLPPAVLRQYANGMNPEVPPYLALGELQRREISAKKMANAQGGQQGPQSSVKEQVEQRAGLMALQQMQQQQMTQQMQQPRGPMPAPAGVPQPDAQPQPTMMAARGGLAGIPVRRDMFEYAGGGIIAFQAGGDTMGTPSFEQQELASQASEMGIADRQRAKLISELEQKLAFLTNIESPKAAEVSAQLEAVKSSGATSPPSEKPSATPRPNPRLPVSEAQATMKAGIQAAVPASKVKPPVAPATARRTTATAPAAAATGIAAALPQGNASPFLEEAARMAREKPEAPTPEGIIAEQNKLLPATMREDAMQKMFADQRARAEARQAAYEKSKPSGLDDLIRVFGQAGQFKGLSGLAPAETAMQQQRRAEDLAMQKQQDELLTAIEGRQYAADKELFGAREKSLTAAQKSFQDRLINNTKVLADLAGVDQRRMDEAAQRLTQMEVAKLQAATAARPSEAERIEAKYMKLKLAGKTKEADEYLNTISAIKGSGATGVGAGRNKIMERRQEMKELESMAKNESGQFSESDAKWAASRISQLARENAREGDGGGDGGAFTVTVGGKTYTFPTQEAANKFKAEAGVK